MNKLKFLLATFVVILLTLGLYSCNKEGEINNESNTQEPQKNEIIVKRIKDAKLDVNSTTKSFNEIAKFKSDYELVIFLDKMNNLSNEENDAIVDNLRYKTLGSKILSISKALDGAKSENDINMIIRNSKGLFWKNSDDEIVLSKLVTKHSIFPFLNEDMMIQVGDQYFKYLGNFCLISKSIENLKLIDNVDKATKLFNQKENNIFGDIKCNLVYRDVTRTDLRSDNGTAVRLEETHDPSWCRNDRRIKLEYAFPENINEFLDPIFGITVQHTLIRQVKIWALKKGIPCIWYTYPADYTWTNFYFEYSVSTNIGTPGTVEWILPGATKNNTYDWVRGEEIAFYVSSFGQFYDVMWTKKKSSVTHIGMNGKWINLNE